MDRTGGAMNWCGDSKGLIMEFERGIFDRESPPLSQERSSNHPVWISY